MTAKRTDLAKAAWAAHVILAACILAIPATARAYDQALKDRCSYVNMSDPGGSMEHVPVFEQTIGDCYANAASEMADAWRFSHGPQPPQPGGYSHITSPSILSDEINRDAGKDLSGDGGPGSTIYVALAALRRHGSCDHSAAFGDPAAGAFAGGREDRLINDLRKLYMDHAKYSLGHREELHASLREVQVHHPDWDPMLQIAEVYYEQALNQGTARNMCRLLLEDGFSSGSLVRSLGASTDRVIAALIGFNNSCDAFVQAFKDRACRNNTISMASLPDDDYTFTADPYRVQAILHRRLKLRPAEPIAIGLCANVLKNPAHRGGPAFGLCDKINGQSDNHVTLVIGRRWNEASGRCEFLVRNSWGPGCHQYRTYPTHWDCEEGKGQLWVDEDALASNIYSVDFLK